MTAAADRDGLLILSGANGPDSIPGPAEIPVLKATTKELRAHLKALWDGIDEHSYEIEWMVSIRNERKTFALDNLIPMLLGTREQCEQFIEENRWEAGKKGYALEVSTSRRSLGEIDPDANYPVILRPVNFAILPDVELATDDWGYLYIEKSGDPEGLQIELSRG